MRLIGRVWRDRRQRVSQRVVERTHKLAVQVHHGHLDRMLALHRSRERIIWPSKAVFFHDSALAQAHQAVRQRIRHRRAWCALDHERLADETLVYLAARTQWPARVLAEVRRRQMDATEASSLGDAQLATEIVHQIDRIDRRAESGDPSLVGELSAAHHRRLRASGE